MPFSLVDYNQKDIQQKLLVIINESMNIPPLHPYAKLTTKQIRQFNVKFHEYIANLPDENYLEIIDKDFNMVMSDVFENFRAEDQFVRNINTDVIPMSSLLDVIVE